MKFSELLWVIFTFTSSTSTLRKTVALSWSIRPILCMAIFPVSPQCGVLVQRLTHFRRHLQFEIAEIQVQIRRLHRQVAITGVVDKFWVDVKRRVAKLKRRFKSLKATLSKYSRKLSHTFRRRQNWFVCYVVIACFTPYQFFALLHQGPACTSQ